MILIKKWADKYEHFNERFALSQEEFKKAKTHKIQLSPGLFFIAIKEAKILKKENVYYVQFCVNGEWEGHYHIYTSTEFREKVSGYSNWEVSYGNI